MRHGNDWRGRVCIRLIQRSPSICCRWKCEEEQGWLSRPREANRMYLIWVMKQATTTVRYLYSRSSNVLFAFNWSTMGLDIILIFILVFFHADRSIVKQTWNSLFQDRCKCKQILRSWELVSIFIGTWFIIVMFTSTPMKRRVDKAPEQTAESPIIIQETRYTCEL